MARATPAEFAAAWVRDWNSRELDVILGHYAEDVMFSSPKVLRFTQGAADTLHGKAALRPYFTAGLAGRPNLRFDLLFVAGDAKGLAIVYRGDDGSTAVETMTLNEAGKVSAGRVFYDPPDA